MSAMIAGALGLTGATVAQAGGGCGCEAPTVVCAPRCHHHHGRHYPPAGILVQSAPVMAAPMMMAAPQFSFAPVQQAPVAQYALVPVPASQIPARQEAPTCQSEENLRAVLRALANNANAQAAPNSPQAALAPQAEQDLDRLKERVGEIESTIAEIRDLIADQNKAILELRKK
ncbi:hypothetical protein NA78x_003632 [Anatilimnocola sp. NA78]|uniref:hypothetical protein n=1 Tax=Anatilimnocola sp. NA78 TaxID=3415683 RepID=UPI003CE49246